MLEVVHLAMKHRLWSNKRKSYESQTSKTIQKFVRSLQTGPGRDLSDEGFFWHVTDMHLDPTYTSDSPAGSCGEKGGDQDSWGDFGDYLCDAPWFLINSSVYAMRQLHPDVDFLIWTG